MNKKNEEALVELLTGIHETLKDIHQQMATPTGKGEDDNEKTSPKQIRAQTKLVIHKVVNPESHCEIIPFRGEAGLYIRKVFLVSDIRPDCPLEKAGPLRDTGWAVDLPKYATAPIWALKVLSKSDGSWINFYCSEPVRISEPLGCIHIAK